MNKDTRIISTTEELKIFSDPFRLNIINVYKENEKPLTVTECAEILGEFPSKILYHVKKLLDINVLELDHIKVINGINAKYYKLTHDQFKIQIKEDSEDVVKKNLQHVNNIMISQIEQFKHDFISMSHKAVSRKIKGEHEVGWFSLNKVHLSEEEYFELEKMLIEYIDSKSKKNDKKNEYSLVVGIANTFKEK